MASPWWIVFDLDGTLLNTLPDITKAVNSALQQLHPSATNELDEAVVRKFVGNGARVLMQKAVAANFAERSMEPAESEHALQVFLEHYPLYNEGVPYPGVAQGLCRLRDHPLSQQGALHMVICTNKPEHVARTVIAGQPALREFFPEDHYITGAVKGLGHKPDKAHLVRAIETFAQSENMVLDSSRIIMIGDGVPDIQVAHNIKCRSIGLTYGFTDREDLIATSPTTLVDDFPKAIDQILDWIGS